VLNLYHARLTQDSIDPFTPFQQTPGPSSDYSILSPSQGRHLVFDGASALQVVGVTFAGGGTAGGVAINNYDATASFYDTVFDSCVATDGGGVYTVGYVWLGKYVPITHV